MNFKEARLLAFKELSSMGVPNPSLEADFILEWATGKGRGYIHGYPEHMLSAAEEAKFKEALERRAKREPLWYITGECEFWGLTFKVGPGCLVPRPETEILVEAALEIFEEGIFLDWGTGSGCIAAAILSEKATCKAVAVDCSPKALFYAWWNFKNLGVLERVLLWHSNGIWDLPEAYERVDLIVSNPPYIPSTEIQNLMPEVRLYEPKEALDGGADGLKYYNLLRSVANRLLSHGGHLVVEIGSTFQWRQLLKLYGGQFDLTDVRKDLSGLDRVLVFQRK